MNKSDDPLNAPQLTIITQSDRETIEFGRRLGSCLVAGDIVALAGELGSGKTWLTKGIALGLGVSPAIVVTSPSFALVNEYQGRVTLFHMDVYRLETVSEFISAGLEEYLYGGEVVVMEWADRWPEILPTHSIKVKLGILDDRRREIVLSGRHPRVVEVKEALGHG